MNPDTPARPIYLDAHATTPVDQRVIAAMIPYWTQAFGNASSKTHAYGHEAGVAVEKARELIAHHLSCKAQEILFTSGATESINLALKGLALAAPKEKTHFVSVSTEHKAVLESLASLQRWGFETTLVGVNHDGLVQVNDIEEAIKPTTIAVAVMMANNEIGVIQPIKEIGEVCRRHAVFLMTDATQGLGVLDINIEKMKIDLLACSAHKIYGPKGVGALFVRRSNPRVKVSCQMHGGGHERGMRSGTLNVPGIVGFAEALRISAHDRRNNNRATAELRDHLQSELIKRVPGSRVNGHLQQRLPHSLNMVLPGVQSEALMVALKSSLAFSSGSACTSTKIEPSHVLKAIGLSEEDQGSCVRFGLLRTTTAEEIDFAIEQISKEALRLQELSKEGHIHASAE
jgi:cysteine desulfurase